MGHSITLTSSDDFKFGAYVAEPAAPTHAGIVVIQEIFGVNSHMRRVTDGFAKEGFLSIAPAIFDRVEPGVELPYDQASSRKGYGYVTALDQNKIIADIDAAISYLRAQPGITKIGVVGFCWGGTLAFLANTRLNIDASVSYYGGGIQFYLEEKPKAPSIYHFAENDEHIKSDVWDAVRAAVPGAPVYTYDAGHAFNRDVGEVYKSEAAAEAMTRTLEFFRKELA
ncbi:dienelactone hydrolase family protein [Granulicella sp. dw_53]|uniref:dienelactone hydrolase family protein n=1 Tax=Granulicella sp. dw_53 TaxID=2719792 RepID=UPI001BD57195|nr:dienelactone hydrolase family protein [Granulicella sp. dw_53]